MSTLYGDNQRKNFNNLLVFLMDYGLEREVARTELLKVMHGGKSEILAKIRPPEQG